MSKGEEKIEYILRKSYLSYKREFRTIEYNEIGYYEVILFIDGEYHWNNKRFQPEADACFWNRNASCWIT